VGPGQFATGDGDFRFGCRQFRSQQLWDYESFPAQIARRLLMLGAKPHVIEERLHYYRPRQRPDVLDIDKNAFTRLLDFGLYATKLGRRVRIRDV